MDQMDNNKEQDSNFDLDDSEGMNENQQALFLNVQRSKSVDSVLGRFLPLPNQIVDRPLVLERTPPITNNILLNHTVLKVPSQQLPSVETQNVPAIRIFKTAKKQRVKGKCDYEKNICGYITKKIIREFVSKNYEKEVTDLVKKYRCNYGQCKAYYLRKVEMVTGPSHLPDLFTPSHGESENIGNCKKAFKQFYRWFLKERYLRYLLLEGKMTDKLAYIEYKNNNLFKFVRQQPEELDLLQNRMQTRSRSNAIIEQEQLDE